MAIWRASSGAAISRLADAPSKNCRRASGVVPRHSSQAFFAAAAAVAISPALLTRTSNKASPVALGE